MAIGRIPLVSFAGPGDSPAGLPALELPQLIEVEPIHTCNLRCLMCHVSYEKLSGQRVDVPRVLENLQGLRGKWAAIGSMYEPMAHPRFAELARGLSDLDMKLVLTTNGTCFTDAVIDKIKDCNFEHVTISFDGVRPGTFEAIRRGADFQRTLERIERFKDALARRGTYFTLNFTVLKMNLNEIPEAVDFWERRGFDHIGFILMVLRDNNDVLRQQSVAAALDGVKEKLLEAARRVIEGNYRITMSTSADFFQEPSALKAQYPAAFTGSLVSSGHPQSRPPFNPRRRLQLGKHPGMHVDCKSPFVFARVSYDGQVELCYQFKIGNLHERRLEDIWQGAQAQAVRAAVMRHARVCHACDYFRFCINAGKIDPADEDNFVSATALAQQGQVYRVPTAIETRDGYDIIAWMGQYYGIKQGLGPVDVRLLDPAALPPGIIMAGSVQAVREQIPSAGVKRLVRRSLQAVRKLVRC